MSIVHYVDIDDGHVACADASDRPVQLDRQWTFVAERVTCLKCLRIMADKREVTEKLTLPDD